MFLTLAYMLTPRLPTHMRHAYAHTHAITKKHNRNKKQPARGEKNAKPQNTPPHNVRV